MKKIELEDLVLKLKSKIFDLERDLSQCQMFGEIGDEKLEKAYQIIDELRAKKNNHG